MDQEDVEAFDTVERLAEESEEGFVKEDDVEIETTNEGNAATVKLRIIDFNETNPIIEVFDTDTFELILDKLENIVGHRCTFEFCYQDSWFIVDDEDTSDAFLEWVEKESYGQADIKIAEANWRRDAANPSKNINSTSKFSRMVLYPMKVFLNFSGISTGTVQPSINLVVAATIGLLSSVIISGIAYFFQELGLHTAAGFSFPSDQSQLGAISGFVAAPIFLTALCCGDLSNRWGRLEFKDFFYFRDPKLGFPDCFSIQLLRFTSCSLIGIPTSVACIVLFCIRNEVSKSLGHRNSHRWQFVDLCIAERAAPHSNLLCFAY